MLRTVFLASSFMLSAGLFSANETVAQSTEIRLKAIPYDASSPEAKSFESNQRSRSALRARVDNVPENQFFGMLTTKQGDDRTRSILRSAGARDEELLRSASRQTVFDSDDQGWFHTTYDNLGVDVYCGWMFDSEMGAEEATDDEDLNAGRMVRTAPPPEPDGSQEGGGNLNDYFELTHKFTFAGARCTITKVCEPGGDHTNCNGAFLEALASSMTIVQRGNRK